MLQEGDFHYVVAAQRFTPQMTRSIDYLNKVAAVGKYHFVQMIQFAGERGDRLLRTGHRFAFGASRRTSNPVRGEESDCVPL